MSSLLFSLCFLQTALAQAPATDGQDRLQFLKAKLAEYSLFRQKAPQSPLPLKKDPIIFYSNPEGPSHSGATFLWLDGERPIAAISLSIRRPNDTVTHEMTSFSDGPLDCQRSGKSV